MPTAYRSADASDTIEHLKSEHSENFGNILSLLRLSAVSESVKLLLRITWLADFMNSGINRKQFTVLATHISRDTFNLKYLREQPTYVAWAAAIPAFE